MSKNYFYGNPCCIIGRNDDCWCGSGKKWKKCHFPTKGSLTPEEYFKKFQIIIKTPEQIQGIRKSCRLAADMLKNTCQRAKAGITTNELNDFAHNLHVASGAIPAPLHFGNPPYPKSICTSLNEVICHGIPNDEPLRDGDIVKIDVSCSYEGYYGDCCSTVLIGEVNEERKKVARVSHECLMRSISILKPGVLLKEIGKAINDHAIQEKCSVAHEYIGHGIGLYYREGPYVLHCYNESEIPLAAGMTFTIEPMINAGKGEGVVDPDDHWTVRTIDGKASAQWEHTVLITETGHEILTLPSH